MCMKSALYKHEKPIESHNHIRVKRGIMSTLTLITYFGQINGVKKFKFDLIGCLYNYAVIHNIKQLNWNIIK